MEISFDPAKSERNVTDRGLPFTLVEQLDWSGAIIEEDVRKNYGERRYLALGLIGVGYMPWCSRPALTRCMSSVCARLTNER